MNKLYDYIVNNFFDTHFKFKRGTGSYKGNYVVDMYIDLFEDYNDPWLFDYEEIVSDISDKNEIIDNDTHYWKSFNILLSNYGLSKQELPIVYEMIQRKVLMRLEELNMTLNEGINESYSLDDKKEFFYKYVAKTLFDTHTEVEDYDGIYIVRNGISHQLISDCEDFQDVMSMPYNPRRYQVDWIIGELMSSLGVTNIEEQREVYQFYLDILKDNYCIDSPINESIDKETKLYNMMIDLFIDEFYKKKVDDKNKTFELLLYLDENSYWGLELDSIRSWRSWGISWVGDSVISDSFDGMFVYFMYRYGVKDRDVINKFYRDVLNKLIEISINEREYYTNKGYKEV